MSNIKDKEYNIILCDGSRCMKKDSREIRKALKAELEKNNLNDRVRITVSACLGMCEHSPVMIVNPGYIIYEKVQISDVKEIVQEHLINDKEVSRLVFTEDHMFNRSFRIFGDVNFFGKQLRITLRNCGIINPESLEDYLVMRGYEAMASVIETMTPQQVIDEVTKSGLRGRGGAGFPTGKKWQFTKDAENDVKYIICNADEGDPGAFMDRSAIEGDPHSLLEGMIIGGYAVGANKGYIYIRAEYPLAIERLEIAIKQAREANLLGENIMGTDFFFDIEIRLGAGAFVCGEETALIHSIEGCRGMPRPKPPFPAVCGLFDKPTCINNVETWANIPVIVLDGADWFRTVGTETSKGTKVFALAGNISNSGLVEVPMGTTLREIVYNIGGGIPDNKEFKAVQIGGPSGGCLPTKYLDTEIDYESLLEVGAMMGSGGMIIMDESACMVNVARFFLEFTQNESCGKCTPCREGTKRMLEILTRITEGKGVIEDIAKLERLSKTISRASLCGLGQSAPNPVLSTLKNFRHEYIEHIVDHKCRAGVCADLVSYKINEKCIGCTACSRICPAGAITGKVKEAHVIDEEKCIKCGLCVEKCKFEAIDRS